MEFLVATNNKKKLGEISRILAAGGHIVRSLADIGIAIEPPEDKETFEENALQKAQMVAEIADMPTLADDSGLQVDVLNGAPGVHSARFAGQHGDDEANNAKLMQLLERTPYAQRGAQFVCAVALVMPNGDVLKAEGRCEGRIGMVASGSGGFGYDPLFYVNDCSLADMSEEEKDEISHRADALRKLLELLPDFLAKQEEQIDANQ